LSRKEKLDTSKRQEWDEHWEKHPIGVCPLQQHEKKKNDLYTHFSQQPHNKPMWLVIFYYFFTKRKQKKTKK
jgi:hypothetical protein